MKHIGGRKQFGVKGLEIFASYRTNYRPVSEIEKPTEPRYQLGTPSPLQLK